MNTSEKKERIYSTLLQVEEWIEYVPFKASNIRDRTKLLPTRKISACEQEALIPQRGPGPNGEASPSHRVWLYDLALALLHAVQLDNQALAQGLVETLIILQNPDGSWGYSVYPDGYYDMGYLRTGAIAWVVHSLGEAHLRWPSSRLESAGVLATEWLLKQRVEEDESDDKRAGLLLGGKGLWLGDPVYFDPHHIFPAAVTEHQLDAVMALRHWAPKEALSLERAILDRLWLSDSESFALAARIDGPDPRRALDAAGSWGALFLIMIGEDERARRVWRSTEQSFATSYRGLRGHRPYLDAVDHPLTKAWEKLIFVEGTMGMALAALRLEEIDVALGDLQLAIDISCVGGPGVPYANIPLPDFPIEPALTPSLWFAMVAREALGKAPAPIFLPRAPTGGSECSS